MAYSLKTNKEIIKWCDRKHLKNQTVSLHWEGGNDSGWCWIEVDGKQVLSDKGIPRQLVDLMYEQLDYGSWAGEFNTHGEAVYNADKKAFVGTDYYSASEQRSVDAHISIRIPSAVWFDTININVQADSESYTPQAMVDFRIRNGFKTAAHDIMVEQLRQELPEKFEEAIQAGCIEVESHDIEYAGMYFFETYRRDQFKTITENGVEMLEYVIDYISLSVNNCDPKDIYLELQEDMEEEHDTSLELNDSNN